MSDEEWARRAVRAMLVRVLRSLESEIACELALVQAARKRLGL